MSKVAVQLTESYAGCNAGERAGFDKEEASRLVAEGKARLIEDVDAEVEASKQEREKATAKPKPKARSRARKKAEKASE
jgi:hypothetical protein